MSAVTKQEIIEALRIPPNTMFFELMRIELINRIEQHGIAPPDGLVLVAEVKKNEAGQIRIASADGSAFDMSKHIGAKLYAAPKVSNEP